MSESKFDRERAEPLFMAVRRSDPELALSIRNAQATLGEFRGLIPKSIARGASPIVKSRFEDTAGGIWLWLSVESVTTDGFEGVTFEAPAEFPELAKGARRFIANEAVADWAVSVDEIMYGGFSLRLQRGRLPEAERASYDKYVGASNGWAQLPDLLPDRKSTP